MKTRKKTRKFDGKIYRLERKYGTTRTAQSRKHQLERKGWNVRLVFPYAYGSGVYLYKRKG